MRACKVDALYVVELLEHMTLDKEDCGVCKATHKELLAEAKKQKKAQGWR